MPTVNGVSLELLQHVRIAREFPGSPNVWNRRHAQEKIVRATRARLLAHQD